MAKEFYTGPDSDKHNATRAALALFGRQKVRDIIALVNARGRSVEQDVFDSSVEVDPPRPLAMLDSGTIPYSDQPLVIVGLATMLMAQIRKPQWSTEQYKEVLESSFSLPGAVAMSIAQKIETEDLVIKDSNKDGNVSVLESASSFFSSIAERARKSVNALTAAAGMSDLMYWDQTQKYDSDLLYELSLLGEEIIKLNRRTRLIAAQGRLQATGMMMFGDIDDDNLFGDIDQDPETGDLYAVGDAMRVLGAPGISSEMAGGYRSMIAAGNAAAARTMQQAASATGVSTTNPALSDLPPSGKRKLGATIKHFFSGDNGKMLAAGGSALALGALAANMFPAVKGAKLVSKLFKGRKQSGDVDDMYGEIADEYGDAVADSWLEGDIEDLADAMISGGYGLPDTGDVGTGDIEMGGIFRRMRINAQQRHMQRQEKRSNRIGNRKREKAMIASGRRNIKSRKGSLRNKRRSISTATNDFGSDIDENPDSEFQENTEAQFDSNESDNGSGNGGEFDPTFMPDTDNASEE